MALQHPTLAGLRVGVMEQFYRVPVQPSATNALRKAAAALAELKIANEPFMPKGLERAPNSWWFFFGEMSAPLLREVIQGREDEAHWTGTEFISTVPPDRNITGKEVIEQFARLDCMLALPLPHIAELPVLLR